MRAAILVIGALALASCDSGEVPTPSEQAQLRPSSPQIAENEVVLRGEGLAAGSEAFYFAAGEAEVRSALASALGKAEADTADKECGAGPMTFINYPGALTVNFQEGRLVGWTLGEASDQVSVEGDVQVGMALDAAKAVDGFAPVAESTLGEEFSVGERIGGFVEDGAVAMLYSGTQCFFR